VAYVVSGSSRTGYNSAMANFRAHVSVVFSAALAAAAFVWLTAASLAAQGNGEAAKMKNPVAAAPESVAAGKALYTKNCAPCHGVNATGGSGNDLIGPAPDLTDAEWQHGSTDGEIFTNIKDGIPPDLSMGPFGDRLKDTDIWNVVNFLRSIAKK
jgi:mono/diheme cytochrome c family protein